MLKFQPVGEGIEIDVHEGQKVVGRKQRVKEVEMEIVVDRARYSVIWTEEACHREVPERKLKL